MGKKVLCIATDVGPSNGLKLVANKIAGSGWSAATLFGNNFEDDYVTKVARTSDRVLIGLSSSEALARQELLAAQTARDAGIPFGFFACNYGEALRHWVRKVLEDCKFLFTVCKEDAAAAREFAPKAKIVASGNPSWATYFDWALSRDNARARLGVSPRESVVLCSGTKIAEINLAQWNAVQQALRHLSAWDIRVFLARHPKEPNPPKEYEKYVLDPAIQFLPPDMSTPAALCGADILIAGHSQTGIEAACKRIPVIDYVSEPEKVEWLRLSGSGAWPPAEQGASIIVFDATGMVDTMRKLLTENSPLAFSVRWAQEDAFKREQFEGAAQQIADVLLAD